MSQNRRLKTGKHLSYAKRCAIETYLNDGYSQRYIAERLDCSPSTVSREIKKHSFVQKSHSNDCLNKRDCHRHNVCGGNSCRKKCKTCNRCKKYCPDYTQAFCDTLLDKGLCNGCSKVKMCPREKKFYKAEVAENEYRELLVGRRNGFDLTNAEIEHINSIVSPLIMRGQSPYHVKQALGDELFISESTLRRMIKGCELDVRDIDLKEAVRRKPRKRKRRKGQELQTPAKVGRMYEDYIKFISENEVNVVEMDCVEGTIEDTCAILTLHFLSFHMQLYYIMPEHTSECVVDVLDMIETAIGPELFATLFEVLLTDNGHEFWDFNSMERSIDGGERTKVFFCDPNRSDQKGACENSHKLFRCIVPKGTSIDEFNQSDMIIATNHVNSYCRKSLLGKCPYDIAMSLIPEDFFIMLGLEKIDRKDVNLKPNLLK